MSKKPSLERITFCGRCPACGSASVFRGVLAMHTRCPHCNLHIAAREQGDGASFFSIVIVGTLVTIAAALTEITYTPAYWVHFTLWPLFIVVGSFICLRFAKAFMLGVQYNARPDDF